MGDIANLAKALEASLAGSTSGSSSSKSDSLWLESLEDLRAVEWSRGYLWDIRFPDGPPAFQKWFPATTVEENLWSITTYEIVGGNSSYEIPKGTSVFTLKIGFIESAMHDMAHWLTEWVNDDMLDGGSGKTGLLEDIVKEVQIKKLLPTKELVKLSSYNVFPKGSQFFSGTSDDTPLTDDIEFIIAETLA